MIESSTNILDLTTRKTPDLIADFKSNATTGLSAKAVETQLEKYGLNKLEAKSVSAWRVFLRQFKSAFIYLILAALVVTLVLGEYLDSLMIFIFLTVNTTLGFFQEYRSERVASFLSRFSLPRAQVLRDGSVQTITSDGLVPGDIILLRTGDKVPADVRILEQKNLTVDESILTGESITVYKTEAALDKPATAMHEAINLGFSGTDVVNGTAKALVVATGKNTALGRISKLATETHKVSDFELGIAKFSNFVIKLVAVTLVVMVAGNILIKGTNLNYVEFIIFSIALTISVIPEALPLVTTFSLSQGARKLAKNNVIVKRLSAVQDLGSIEVLCSDKTGTLTENRLEAVNFYSADKPKLILGGCLASAFELKVKTEPFDIALMGLLDEAQKAALTKVEKLEEDPFDPHLRRNIVHIQEGGRQSIITRGAPEDVMYVCAGLSESEKQKVQEWVKTEGRLGRRTLAVAEKTISGENPVELKQVIDFTLLGLVSFVDTIKPSTFEAIRSAKELGVRVIVITGDSREVAGAVAFEIGLTDSPDKVLSGNDWEGLPVEKREKALKEFNVFYRVSPEQKFMLVSALHEKKMVGFLGEGINDAPALKVAGVSLVVDSASDIAREVADIILTQPGLQVIVDGIREGRLVFANTIKYIKATLISNFGNFFAIAVSSFLIDFLPMLPVQILLVNLLSDTPMISISSDTADPDELTNPNKYEVKEITLMAIILGVVSTFFDFLFFGLFYRISPGVLQTNWFIGSILTELTLIFSVRTRKTFFRSSRPSNSLLMLTILAACLTILIPLTKFGAEVFKFVPPTTEHLVLILGLVATYFLVSEVVKIFFYRSMGNAGKPGSTSK
jgi:P-type Mg2+ transporter